MQAIKLKAVIDGSHRLQIDLPPDTPTGEAEVIVLVESAAQPARAAAGGATLRAFFETLDRRAIRNPRSREDIEAQIAAERAGWD